MSTETKERRPPLDTPAAADYLNVLPSYLERLRCNGDGPVFIKRNGLVRYDPSDLDAWLEAGKKRSTSRSAGTLYDVVEGRPRWARIKDGEIVGLYYHAEKPEQEGYIWLPVVHEDSESFDIARHWRLTPHDVLESDRVRRVYPVVPKSVEWA